ncbi:hypothetical protein [Pseudomonas sp. CFBP 13602]|uniref:hypothetical protein n=1 Tax=Pseudomonas sp. CFBP 13602 TaxID=2774039 RepID=UPI0017849923|nr:hypothetical protein [Pseudomonas sp. CFBP 13602]MBD8829014.1 hypothetical protein [Pseudomonas sp. CFBP 13602]
MKLSNIKPLSILLDMANSLCAIALVVTGLGCSLMMFGVVVNFFAVNIFDVLILGWGGQTPSAAAYQILALGLTGAVTQYAGTVISKPSTNKEIASDVKAEGEL